MVLLYSKICIDHDLPSVATVISESAHLNLHSIGHQQGLIPVRRHTWFLIGISSDNCLYAFWSACISYHAGAEDSSDRISEEGLEGWKTSAHYAYTGLHARPDEDITHDPGDIDWRSEKSHEMDSEDACNADTA